MKYLCHWCDMNTDQPQLQDKAEQKLLGWPEVMLVHSPGVSTKSLCDEGIYRPSMATLTELGFKSKGYLIPYHDYEGNPILDNGKPFYRVRLDEAKGTNGKQKGN